MTLDETAVRDPRAPGGRATERRAQLALRRRSTRRCTPMGARLLRQWLLRPLLDPARSPRARTRSPRSSRRRRRAPRCAAAAAGRRPRAADQPRHARRGPRARPRRPARRAWRRSTAVRRPRRVAAALARWPSAARRALADLDDLRAHAGDGAGRRAAADAPRGRPHPRELERGARGARRATRRGAASGSPGSRSASGRAPASSSLRVRFNRVFGYGIEVTHAQAARVPAEYVRRQTLTGAERYVTPELKEYEAKVLGADERRRRLEYELFDEVRAPRGGARRRAAGHRARPGPPRRRWRRSPRWPTRAATCGRWSTASGALDIVEGRHPVLEARRGSPVTPERPDARPTTRGS